MNYQQIVKQNMTFGCFLMWRLAVFWCDVWLCHSLLRKSFLPPLDSKS